VFNSVVFNSVVFNSVYRVNAIQRIDDDVSHLTIDVPMTLSLVGVILEATE
jgi:hypothetical protein